MIDNTVIILVSVYKVNTTTATPILINKLNVIAKSICVSNLITTDGTITLGMMSNIYASFFYFHFY